MPTLVTGIAFTALGLAVVVDELAGLRFGQTMSLFGLAAAVAILVGAVYRARFPLGHQAGGPPPTVASSAGAVDGGPQDSGSDTDVTESN